MNLTETIDILVNVALGIIMLGLGLSLTFNDFKNLFRLPKPIIVGFLSQIIVLPIISFAIAYFSHLSDIMKVGLIIIAICPVGASSSLVVHLFKGNLALSLSLTIINSIIAPITIPILTNIALFIFLHQNAEINFPILQSIAQIGLNIILPTLVGIFIRYFFEKTAKSIEKPLKYILPIILLIVFSSKIFYGGDNLTPNLSLIEIFKIAPYVLALNIIGMYSGFFAARLMKLELKNRVTIAIEVGLQNTALALVVAGSMLKNSEMEKPILVYAMFTFFTAILFAWYHSRAIK